MRVVQAEAAPRAFSLQYPGATDAELAALAEACHALWAATLSLMTAFMQTQAPAHRYLLARRIARNFTTLKGEACFADQSRESFARLADRWALRADRLAPKHDRPAGGGLIPSLLKSLSLRA